MSLLSFLSPRAAPDPLPATGALADSFHHWLRLKGRSVPADRIRQQLTSETDVVATGLPAARHLGEAVDPSARFVVLDGPQVAALPLLSHHAQEGWLVVLSRTAEGLWRCSDVDGRTLELVLEGTPCLHMIDDPDGRPAKVRTARDLMLQHLRGSWRLFAEAAGLSLVLACVGITISFYTMQVYDRVIPSQGFQTLWVLTVGVALAVLVEWLLKHARAMLLEPRLKQLDVSISKALMSRLNAVRMDQRPGSVGSLASQIQSFESIRGVLSTSTLFVLFDMPMALLFALVMAMIGGVWMALPPLVLFMLTVLAGLVRVRRISRLSASNLAGANAKTGLLVETIEGAEAIKGMGAAWRFESRWAGLSESNAIQSLALKQETDGAVYLAASLQQASYISLICIGAALAIDGHITQGAIVACSILSGRVLSPLASIPGLLVQMGNARASMKALDAIFKLETDNQDIERPLVPQQVEGHLLFEDVEFAYPGQKQPLRIGRLQIKSGEKVAILGGIGAGKSTLLSLACGLSRPTKGTVFLNGVDQQQIHAGWRGEHLAYCPQQAWLCSGTLRDNLTFGLTDVSDERILEVAKQTGLWAMVAQHPLGLDRKLSEGGRGLSGGQRQLVALTRMLLTERDIWMLDEPTSGMDDGLEMSTVKLMKATLKPSTTLLLVTHRLSMLALVDRVIVLNPQGIVLDGPRDQVLARLQQRPTAEGASASAGATPAPAARPGTAAGPITTAATA